MLRLGAIALVATFGCRLEGPPPSRTQSSADGAREQPAAPVVRAAASTDATAAPTEIETLAAIRVAVERFFAQPAAVVEAELGPDTKALLPREVGQPVRTDDELLLPPWRVKLEGDHAMLTYTHPSMIHANWRSWFSLSVGRSGGVWSVPSGGLGTGIACALRVERSSDKTRNDRD